MKKILLLTFFFFFSTTHTMFKRRATTCVLRSYQTKRTKRLFTTDAENEFHTRLISAMKTSRECKETLTDPEITYEDLLLTKLKVNEIEHIRRETNSYFKKELKSLTDMIRYMELENDYQQLNTRMETLEQIIKGIFGPNQ